MSQPSTTTDPAAAEPVISDPTPAEINVENPLVPRSALSGTTGMPKYAWYVDRADISPSTLTIVKLVMDGRIVCATNLYDRATNKPTGGRFLGQGYVLGKAGDLHERAIVEQAAEKDIAQRILQLRAASSAKSSESAMSITETTTETTTTKAPVPYVCGECGSVCPCQGGTSRQSRRSGLALNASLNPDLSGKLSFTATSSDSSDVNVRQGNASELVDITFQMERDARLQAIEADADIKRAEAQLVLAKEKEKALQKMLKAESKAAKITMKAQAKGLKKDAKVEAKIAKRGSLSADLALEGNGGEVTTEVKKTRRLSGLFRRRSSSANVSADIALPNVSVEGSVEASA